MSQVLKATVGWSDQSGRGYQQHVLWCENAGCWLLLVVLGSDVTKLHVYFNNQLDFTQGTWSECISSPYTFVAGSLSGATGVHFSADYRNISGFDVLHIDVIYPNSSFSDVVHLRCLLSGRTFTVSSETTLQQQISTGVGYLALNSVVPADNKPGILLGNGNADTVTFFRFPNADLGTSWTTPGNPSQSSSAVSAVSEQSGGASFSVYSKTVHHVFSDGGAGSPNSMTKLLGGHNFLGTDLGFTAVGAGTHPNNFGAVVTLHDQFGTRNPTTERVHAVLRTGTNTYSHRMTPLGDTGTWGAGASIPNQNSLDAGGLFMTADVHNVWLFVIDTDAANTVRYIKYSEATQTWDASWSVLESSTKVRTSISGCREVLNRTIAVTWTEQNGANFDLAGQTLIVPPDDSAALSAQRLGWGVQRNMQLGGTLAV